MNTSELIQIGIWVVLFITLLVYGWIAWNNHKTLKALRQQAESQVFVDLLDRFSRERLSIIMDRIRTTSLPPYSQLDPELKEDIRTVVDFFNDLGHLIRHGMVEERKVMGIYRASLVALADKLLPWWVDGIRKEQGSPVLYRTFAELAERARTQQQS